MPAKPTPLQRAIDAAAAKGPRNIADRVLITMAELPPGKNHLRTSIPIRKNGKLIVRTFNSKHYTAWINVTLDHILKIQRPAHVPGDVEVHWLFETNRARDIDGCLEAGFDMLTKARIIADDNKVVGGSFYWADVRGVLVEVRSAK